MGSGFSSTTWPLSAVALGTVVVQKSELDLLIVWRGSPGWFMKAGSTRESGGGNSTGYGGSMSRGGIDLDFQLTTQPRTLKIQGAPVELGTHNVVLVDDVDGSQGPKVLSVLSVGRDGVTDPREIAVAVKRSPELIAFLKCGIALESAYAKASTERLCREIGR